MTSPSSPATHLDDGALIQLLDGADADVTAAAATHIAQCLQCTERFLLVRRRWAAVSHRLARTRPVELSEAERAVHLASLEHRFARRRRSVWIGRALRATAAVVVFAAAAAAATPLRAWFAEHIFRMSPSPPPGASAAVGVRASEMPSTWSRVSFSSTGAVLVIRLDAQQAAGELIIELGTTDESSASVIGARSEEIVVLPDGIRVRNDSGSAASYRVVAGRGIRRVVLHIGPARPRVVLPQSAETRLRLDGSP